MQQLPTFSIAEAIDRNPLLVEAESSVSEVVELMSQTSLDCPVSLQSGQSSQEADALAAPQVAQKDVSYVLVIRNGQLSGIITEKDIVRLVAEGRSLTDLSVSVVMSQPVLTLRAEVGQDIFTALAMMRRHKIHHLPVVDEQGQLMGLLTPRRLRSVMAPAEFMRFRRVHEVMSTEVVHALPTVSLLHVVQTLVQHKVSCVVVAQPNAAAAGRVIPVGIITERDVVQFQRLGLTLERTQAETVMSGPLFLVGPQDSLWSVDKKMRHHKVRRLVVADADGQLAGVVTQGALLPVDPVELYEVVELLQDKMTQLETEKAALLEQRNQQLEDERDRFFSLSPDVFCIVDLDGKLKTFNTSLERILGYSTAELASKAVSDLIHPEDRAAGVAERDRLESGGYKTINYEDRYRCKDGSYRRFLWSATYEPQQQLIYAIARDITEYSQIGQALAAKVKQQAAITRLGQLAVSLSDLQHLMDEVTTEVAQTLEIEYCKVLELLEDGESLRLRAGVGWQPGLVGEAIIGADDDSQASYTLQSTAPVIVTDLRCETRFSGPALLRDHHVISGISVIIQGTHQPYGVLEAHSTRLRHFSDEDVAFLQSVANLLAQNIEQRQAEKELRQSERDYRTLAENLPGIVYRVFPEDGNRMQFLNNQCQEMTGYNAGELSSGEVCYTDQLILPEDRSQVIDTINAATNRRTSFQVEYRIKDKSGNIRHFLEKGQTIKNTSDQPVHIDGVIFDVTERTLAERAEQESQQRLNSILETSKDVVWSAAVDSSQMLYMSPSAEITYGRLPAEFFNNPNLWSEVVHPDDRVGVDAFFEEIFEKAQANHEYRIVLPDGSVRWMLDRTWLVYDEQGDPIRVDGVSTDVSDSVLARQKISEQAALLDVSNDAIIVRGMDGQILFWNKGAEALYGWQAEEALGQNAEQLMYGDDTGVQETVQSEIFPTLAHQGTWRDERQSITKAGDRLTVISRWTSVKDPQGNPTSILIVNTDITEQKQMEEQFFRAQRLESLGILASGIAHDLNNIMTPILGVAQLLPMQLPDLSEQIREELNVLQVSARRGSEIIGQVLSFARGAEGDGEASSGKNRPLLNVKHLISEIKNFAGKTFPKSFDFTVDIPNDLWAVEGDATKLYQVFMNLFVNARDAMPKGGNLSVLATNLTVDSAFATHHLDAQPGPYIMVTIADTGKGIPLEVLDRIFEPFFTTKKSEGGTGLGLSTVHGIVRSHGGFVTVYSEVGRGSQFKVYLPAIASTAATPTEVPTASLAGHRELVLVVDDEEPILEITRSILEAHNYQVITAVDGIDAIANYTEHKASISIVLMDITMPNLDGATAIQIMQKINPELKVIVTSGLLSNQQHTSLIGNSVKTFLQKPYSPEGLLQSIQSVFQSEYEDRT